MSHQQSNTTTINSFDTALLNLANTDIAVSKINLTELANANKINLDSMQNTITHLLGQLVDDKHIILNGFNYKGLVLTNKISQAIKRHNIQVVWSMARAHFESDGQTSAFLSHVSVGNKGAEFKGALSKKVFISSFSTFDSCEKLISFSVKKDDDVLNCTISPVDIDFQTLLADYDEWQNNLVDYTDKLTLVSDSTTTPDTLAASPKQLVNAELLNSRKVVQDVQDNLKISKNDLVTSQSEIKALKARIVELEQENKILHSNLSPAKQKKLKAA